MCYQSSSSSHLLSSWFRLSGRVDCLACTFEASCASYQPALSLRDRMTIGCHAAARQATIHPYISPIISRCKYFGILSVRS